MDFYDKNGTLLRIGDQITPDKGQVLTLLYSAYVDDEGQECLVARQKDNPIAFSYLTQENLSQQWTKTADALASEAEQALNILLGVDEEWI